MERWKAYGYEHEAKTNCKPGEIIVLHDLIVELIDKMAHICECWKWHRDNGYMPQGIRDVVILVARDIIVNADRPLFLDKYAGMDIEERRPSRRGVD